MIPNISFQQDIILHQSNIYASLPRAIRQMRIDLLSGTMPTEQQFKNFMPNNNMVSIPELSQQIVDGGATIHGTSAFANNALRHSGVGVDWMQRSLDMADTYADISTSGIITHALLQFSQDASPIVSGSSIAYAFLLTVGDVSSNQDLKMKSTTVEKGSRVRFSRLILDFGQTFGGNP